MSVIPSKDVILHLSLIPTIGPHTIARLVKGCSGNMYNLYAHARSDFLMLGFTPRIADALVQGLANLSVYEKEKALIARYGIRWVTILDPEYPTILKEIYAPPAVLYWQGSAKFCEQKALALVGSRQASSYSHTFIQQIVPALVSNQWAVVSGGARGADTMAHQVAVKENGVTIAVLGSGLLQPFPRSNVRLFDQIASSGGAVVSPFSLQTEALPGNFPARNRIIAGLSRGCIVTQAAIKSGARITAQCALEEGRDVFALPGPIDDPLSAGCHALIQQGAKLVTNAQDILAEYHEQAHDAPLQQSLVGHSAANLSSVDALILKASKNATTFDELLAATLVPDHELHAALFDLQIAGRIQQDVAGRWIAV